MMNNRSPIMSTLPNGTVLNKMYHKLCLLDARVKHVMRDPESGLATAEYAIVMIAATGFAGLLVALLKSSAVKSLLNNLITTALSLA